MNDNDREPAVDTELLSDAIDAARDYEAALVRRWRAVRKYRADLSALRDGTEDLNEAIWRGAA